VVEEKRTALWCEISWVRFPALARMFMFAFLFCCCCCSCCVLLMCPKHIICYDILYVIDVNSFSILYLLQKLWPVLRVLRYTGSIFQRQKHAFRVFNVFKFGIIEIRDFFRTVYVYYLLRNASTNTSNIFNINYWNSRSLDARSVSLYLCNRPQILQYV